MTDKKSHAKSFVETKVGIRVWGCIDVNGFCLISERRVLMVVVGYGRVADVYSNGLLFLEVIL